MDNSNSTSNCNVGHSIGSGGKTFEKTPGQRNSRTGLQKKIIHQTNILSYGGVDLNSALKRRNYGNIWNTGIRIWTNSIHSNTKTNKDLKRKRNSIIESQRRVMH